MSPSRAIRWASESKNYSAGYGAGRDRTGTAAFLAMLTLIYKGFLWVATRKPSAPISETRRKRTNGSTNSTSGVEGATFRWLKPLGPREPPHLPLRAAPILKPPALPGDTYSK